MSGDQRGRILAAVPIESYIGRYVRLQRSGKSLKGLCPFHKEKSPSFTVSPDKGFFHCFGCGKGGDLFRFVMDYEGIPFTQALQRLARYAGIELRKFTKKSRSHEDRLVDLNGRVMQAFRDFLHTVEGKPYKRYLLQRGLEERSIKHFQLGASPDQWSCLTDTYAKYQKELLQLGLIRSRESDPKSHYDFFRNRVIFPIWDVDERVLGFGGRTIDDQAKREAKYINSSDSPLFKKSRSLYGLFQNLAQMRSRQEALLVEGYLDVIGLWQIGKNYACAPLGTAFTSDHLRILQGYVKALSLLFDGDVAGLRAAIRSTSLLLRQPELRTYVILLPPGLDPFDLCIANRVAQLDTFLEYKIDAADFFLMESMFPQGFHEYHKRRNTKSSETPSDFGDTVKRYYSGEIADTLPSGMQKRLALDNLYKNLIDFTQATDRHLLLEGAAKLLKLNLVELQQEWDRRYGQRLPHSSPSASPSFPRDELRFVDQTIASPKHPNADPKQKLFASCERNMLLEILFQPSLMENFHKEIVELEFEDIHSDFLWHHLESRYLIGSIWKAGDLRDLELPEETRECFSALVIQGYEQGLENKWRENKPLSIHRRNLQRESSRTQEEMGWLRYEEATRVVKDYLLKHRSLKLEKNIEGIEAFISVADPVEKSHLLEKKGDLIREHGDLKRQWRSMAK